MTNNYKNLGPRQRDARSQSGVQSNINLSEYQVSFDKQAFTDFVKGQGIKVTHYRAIPDPTGMTSRGDNHAVAGTRQSSDGFIYKPVGSAHVLFSTNSASWDAQNEGNIQHAVAYMTLPDKYETCDLPFLVTPWDRFYIEDIECRVINVQYLEASSTGVDRLQFPATCVEHLIDANGIEYQEGTDFEITKEGWIKWISQKRPGWNITVNRGTVYSIRYRYTPFFIVTRLLHEIRISQVTNPATGDRTVERMPYQIQVVREYIFQDVNVDPAKNMVDSRLQNIPDASGVLGPTGQQ